MRKVRGNGVRVDGNLVRIGRIAGRNMTDRHLVARREIDPNTKGQNQTS